LEGKVSGEEKKNKKEARTLRGSKKKKFRGEGLAGSRIKEDPFNMEI